MILWSFVGFVLILWLAKLQHDHSREQNERRERQRLQRVGLEPIRGVGAQSDRQSDLDAEEARLLAVLRERQNKTGGLWASGMPASVKAELDRRSQPRYLARPTTALAAAHTFHTSAAKLSADLETLRGKPAPDGMIWVSWPKKVAKVETDITEDAIRAIALPMGFVDVKVCAVDQTWSGLKLVIRKTLR